MPLLNSQGYYGYSMKLAKKKKIALVLSGGGVKAAAFHVGVCLALQEKGFTLSGGIKDGMPKEKLPLTIDLYVGSSAGAVITSFLASGYSIDAIIDAFEMGNSLGLRPRSKSPLPKGYLKPFTYFDIFAINSRGLANAIPNFLKRSSLDISGGIETHFKKGFKVNGLFTTRGIEKYFRKHVLPTNRFDQLGVQLFITATQLNHSRKVIFGAFDKTSKDKTIKWANFATISDAVAASTSLPPVFAPYGIKNNAGKEIFFFDGEIRDTLSTHVAADNNADLVISSYSIQPYHYNDERGSLHNYGIPLILTQALYQVGEQKILRHIQYQNDIKGLLSAVDGYFKQANLPEKDRLKLKKILEDRVKFRPGVDYLYIHPNPQDYQMFFVDHFSLNPQTLGEIVRMGFRSAVGALRKLDI